MFPEGRTYFTFFIETEGGRCAPRLRRKHDAMLREEFPHSRVEFSWAGATRTYGCMKRPV